MLRLVLVLALALASACGDDDTTIDATVADAGPDAQPGAAYPPGPYGTGATSTIADMSFIAWVDNDDGGNSPFDNDPRLWSLHEYYRVNDPDATCIMINASAGWCGWCMEEMQTVLPTLISEFSSRGARFAVDIFQDDTGAPPTREWVRDHWGEPFNLTVPTLVDSTFQMGQYFEISATPMNMFINARTMEIIMVTTGYAEVDAFRQILDYYCN